MAKQTMGFGRLRFGRRWPFILVGCITICCSVFLSLSLTVTLTCAKEVPLS